MDWIIHPLVGAGQLRFGMTSEETQRILGKPHVSEELEGQIVQEFRDLTKPILTFEQDSLCEIGFTPESGNISLRSHRIKFGDMKFLKQLESEGGILYQEVGFLISPTLGISCTGFFDDTEEQLAINVFRKGFYDEFLESAKLITFL